MTLRVVPEGLAAASSAVEGLTARLAAAHAAAAPLVGTVLPPAADASVLETESAAAYAREHPDRQDVRIVAGATRAGATYCALRLRAADEDRSVLTGAELVPGLLALLRETLEDDAGEAAGDLAAPGEDD